MTTTTPLFGVDSASVTRTVLPNGLKVLIKSDFSAPVVAIVTFVSAGYFDETDDIVGIAHVLEHMYFKGTPSRGVGEIAKQTKAVGGYLNAATIYDHTSYYTVLPASGFRQGLEVQADPTRGSDERSRGDIPSGGRYKREPVGDLGDVALVDLVAVRGRPVDRRQHHAHQRRQREDQQRRPDGAPVDPHRAEGI